MSELRKCSRCHSTKLEQYFSVNVKGELYKLCDTCRTTQKEYKHEEWKEKNKEKIQMYAARAFQKWLGKPLDEQRVECPCGKFYRYKAKHLETKHHKDYLETLDR